MNTLIISTVITIIIAACFVLLGAKTDMLKDSSTAKIKPFSFARVQLAWWSAIVIGSYIYIILSKTGWINGSTECNIISQSALVLLGIGVTTTGAARLIDNSQIDGGRHQDSDSEGFMLDILSDENGVSIHRFQFLIFNFIFGLMFVVKVYSSVHTISSCAIMPDFTKTELTLMGLSSAAYAGMKIGENSNQSQAQG